MKKYKDSIKTKIIIESIAILFFLLVVAILFFFFNDVDIIENTGMDIQLNMEMNAFRIGICSAIIALLAFRLISTLFIWRNEERLKKKYIKEHDEREQMIQYKTMKATLQLGAYGLLVSLFITSFYSMEVVMVLYWITMGLALTKTIMYFYYSKKL